MHHFLRVEIFYTIYFSFETYGSGCNNLCKPIVHDTSYQHKAIAKLNCEFKENEIFIVIDFSEKYEGKHETQIQNAHLGISLKQIALLSCVFYEKYTKEAVIK